MGTGLIYNGQMSLEKWKELYYFDDGVWKEIPKKPIPSGLRYIKESEDHPLTDLTHGILFIP
jgi:hypothetical protein